jgi:hypothetical protein
VTGAGPPRFVVFACVEAGTPERGSRRRMGSCALLLLSSVCACAPSEAAKIQPPRVSSRLADAPDERFLVRPDGTALDRRTGVIWQRCPLGTVLDDHGTPQILEDDRCLPSAGAPQTLTWKAALTAARQLDESGGFAGHSDWRVPGQKELLSLIEARWREPRIVGRVFPLTPPDPFSASTVYSANETLSWEAHSREGGNPAIRVRLVR